MRSWPPSSRSIGFPLPQPSSRISSIPAAEEVSLVKSTLPVYRVKLVRERTARFEDLEVMNDASDAARVARAYLGDEDREHFLVMMVSCQNALIGLHTVSIGTINQALVGPREVFRAAILANAASIIVAHNHPSGDPEPSPEDQVVTDRLRKVGELLEIPLLDHIIVGPYDRFVSLRRLGRFDRSF